MNFVKKYCLNRQLRDFLQKRVNKNVNVHALKGANSICFLIRGGDSNRVDELLKIASQYKEKKMVIVCYLSSNERFNMTDTPSFLYTLSSKDVGLTGRIGDEKLKNIFLQHYDIFIDMNDKTDLISLYLQTLFNADFRIGGNKLFHKHFDFVLCADEQRSLKEYMSNLELYTSYFTST